jgi:LPXTG-motif cell wall-anchored protein
MRTRRTIRRATSVALLAIGLGLAAPEIASAGEITSCTFTFDPSTVTITDSTADDEVLGTSSASYSGWFGPGVYQWLILDSGTPMYLGPAPAMDVENPFTAGPIRDLFELVGVTAGEYGTYTITFQGADNVVDGVDPAYDAADMHCSEDLVVIYAADEMPATGSNSAIASAWAIALLGLGAATVLAVNRRRI